MKELVVISGKGGTGKTSIVASFAALAENAVLADRDVDAADLHIILQPRIRRREDFSGGSRAAIHNDICTACGLCRELCRFDAVSCRSAGAKELYEIDPVACEGCGVCAYFCPADAVAFGPAINGEWYVSDTRHGPMVHAKLFVGEENSGKLVTQVRRRAKEVAIEQGRVLLLADGSPGIGCPVIASITGANLVLVVTEPTPSGLHDLKRVADLAKHFGIGAMVCINKWDLNESVSREITAEAGRRDMAVAGRIRYDRAVTDAQRQRLSVVEFQHDGVAEDIQNCWRAVLAELNND